MTADCDSVIVRSVLIARGYLNTYLASLFLAPLSDGELDQLANVENRLDQIVGIKGRNEAEVTMEGPHSTKR
jgi:hypothetical protein